MVDKTSRKYLQQVKEKYGLKPPILNACSGAGVEQRYYLPVYKEFENFNLDIIDYEGVDIVADVCDMPQVPSNSYGTVVCIDGLEHITYPHRALKEFYRILKPGGSLIISTVMSYAVHRWGIFQDDVGFSKSHFKDYWRFTPDGLRLIIKDAGFTLLHLSGQTTEYEVMNLADLPIGEDEDKASFIKLFATARVLEWTEIDVDVDLIEVGDPTFEWFLDRLGDKVMEDRFQSLYGKPLYDKEERLDWFEEQYAVFLHVPILVKEVLRKGEKRYELRDGYHRLAILVKRKGKKHVKAQVWQPWMTDEDWWNQTRKMILDSVHIPQAKYLHGKGPYELQLEGSPHYNGPVYSFMISTGVKVPYIMKNWNSLGRVEARGDRFKGPWTPRIELILGEGNHEIMMDRWGTQPLNTYLVGHFCCGPHIHTNALASKIGTFAQIQQYYRSGYWGDDPPNYPQAVPTLREQLVQDLVGVPLLYDLGILTEETKIYFADQSRTGPLPADEAEIFKGRDCLRDYFKWIPTYIKKRKRDFSKSIEEVLSCLPLRIPA